MTKLGLEKRVCVSTLLTKIAELAVLLDFKRATLPLLIGSFSNDDGNGNENVITKHKFSLL